MEAVINNNQKKRRSVALSTEEKGLLKKYISQFTSVVEAAENIGIHRNVLDRVLLTFSGSPETIEKVRAIINKDSE